MHLRYHYVRKAVFTLALTILLSTSILSTAQAASFSETFSLEALSLDSSGAAGERRSDSPSISADGTKIAFESFASNLVSGDTNNSSDVFVHDTTTGITTRVSVSSTGEEANNYSHSPSISADGTKIAFESTASNLAKPDTDIANDIFVHDTTTGTTKVVSVRKLKSGATLPANGVSTNPSISTDGLKVAFTSAATNLVTDDTNSVDDIFVYNALAGTTERVSTPQPSIDGVTESNGDSDNASINADGTVIAFESEADNLVTSDTNTDLDLFVHSTKTGSTERISVDSSGTEGNDRSTSPSINADGTKIAFHSTADNLVENDTDEGSYGYGGDVFLHDTSTGSTERISVNQSGTQGDYDSFTPSINPDGTKVAFGSLATNLVIGDTNYETDTFVKDLTTGKIKRVSVRKLKTGVTIEANGYSGYPSISSDGTKIAFQSEAGNLMTDDGNGDNDVFLATHSF